MAKGNTTDIMGSSDMGDAYLNGIDGSTNTELDRMMHSLMSPMDSGIESIETESVSSRNLDTVCPVCKQSKIKYYQITMTERFKMCGDELCVYPFNLTEKQIKELNSNTSESGKGSSVITPQNSTKNKETRSDSGVGELENNEDDIRGGFVDANTYINAENSDDEDQERSAEETRIDKLLHQSSKLIAKLNEKKNKRKPPLTDTTYLRKLASLQNHCKSKHRLLTDEEVKIMKESERKIEINDQIEVNIQLPVDSQSLIKIDILKA